MSGPGGSTTKRDQRRDSRRAQFQQRQLERQRETRRRIRNQRIRRYSIIGGTVVIVALLAFLLIHATVGAGGSPASTPQHGAYTTPANGVTRDGLSCGASEGTAEHYHVYLAIYANGKQVQVPPNTNITSTCLYPLHVHDIPGEENIIHIESPTVTSYTLGQFFDLWGQPISKTQAMSYKADSAHQLVYKVVDANGKVMTYTGNPWNIPLQAHETIYILYNSSNVTPTPFTAWNGL